mgnify:CR=1 FL=1
MPPDAPKWLAPSALDEVLHDQTHEPGFATAQKWTDLETLFPGYVSQSWTNQETLFPSHVF